MKRVIPLLMATCIALPVFCLADLHDPDNSADHMIVTTQELIDDYPWINQLAEWRTNHGRTAMVVATNSVWAEFGTGTPSDTVLKDFLHYARENWQPPQLKDVFMIGFHDVVPSHVEADILWPDSIEYLTDFFYAEHPDSFNHFPLLNVGRLPWTAEDNVDLWNYYDKVVAYESAIPAPWQTRVHMIADTMDATFNFAEDFAEYLAQQIQPGYTVERDYLDYPIGDPWHGDRQEILVGINSGSYLLEYHGHTGNCYDDTCDWGFWSPVMHLDSTDFAALSNGEQMPIVVGMNNDMHQNSFALSGVVASLLSNFNGGAVGYFGWTIGWANNGRTLKRHLTRLATSDTVATLGELWNLTGTRYRQQTLYEWSFIQRQTLYGMMLFGDPGLVLPPRPTAAHDIQNELPQSIRLIGNYPNPFNSSTTIKFELNAAVNVSLKVYDVLGRETATLVNGVQMTGSHAVTWDASRAASGVYFAELEAGEVRQTMKMMLLK